MLACAYPTAKAGSTLLRGRIRCLHLVLLSLPDESCMCYRCFARLQLLVLKLCCACCLSCCLGSAGAVFVVLFALPAIGLLLSGDTAELISHLIFNAG